MPTRYKSPYLSIVIPAYNEETRLGPNLGPIFTFLNKHYPKYELIIVNDGSRDNTATTVQQAIRHEPRAKLISYTPNRGKGFAVRTGVRATTGDLVLFMDADLSTPLSEIPKILALITTADIVIGSRGLSTSTITSRPPLFRRFASVVFDQVKYFLVGLRQFKDTQCGFKLFKGPIARQLFALGRIDRFMFDSEILYLAERAGLTIVEMPVFWADVPAGSTVKFWEGIYFMFRDLWRIRRIHPRRITLSTI